MAHVNFFSSHSTSQQVVLYHGPAPATRLINVIQAVRNVHTWFSPQEFSIVACTSKLYARHTTYVWKQLYLKTEERYQNTSPAHEIPPHFVPESYQSAYLQLSKLNVPLTTPGLIISAAENGASFIVDLIASHHPASINERDATGHTALSKAVISGHTHVIKTLLAHRADLTYGYKVDKLTVLMMTARGGNNLLNVCSRIKIMNVLLDAGANIDAVDDKGRSVLWFSAINREPLFTRLLLTLPKPATVDLRDHLGVTPLMVAAAVGNIDVATTLIESHADVDAIDHKGYTPLAHAANESQTAAVMLLVLKKANIHMQNNEGAPILQMGTLKARYDCPNQPEVIRKMIKEFLRKAQTSPPVMSDYELLRTIEKASDYWQHVLVALYANIPGAQGNTLLIRSVGAASTVKTLLKAGAEINMQNHIGQTALMIAAKSRFTSTVRMLLDFNANVTLKDANGKTALDYAQVRDSDDDEDYCKALAIQGMLD